MHSAIRLTPERCEIACVHPEHVAPLLNQTLSPQEAESVSEIFGLLPDPSGTRMLHALSHADAHIRHVLVDGRRHAAEERAPR